MQVTLPPASAAVGPDGKPFHMRWTSAVVVPLAALTGINLFNYMDRFVLSALYTELEKPLELGGLGLDKGQEGTLYSAFIIVYALLSPLFGVLGDRWRRMWIIAGAVVLWSLATAAGGLAAGFLSLLVARAFTGIGEAAYASITPSVLSDLVPAPARGRALSWFNAAIPVGAALGFGVGGFMVSHFGWREAFLAAGLPGLGLAVFVAFLREPVRGAMDGARHAAKRPLGQMARQLWRRQFILPTLGYVLQTAGFGALGIWAPTFLEQAKGIPQDQATMLFGVIVVTTGLSGTLLGGWLGDRWLRRDPRALMWTCALSSLAAVPCVAAVSFLDSHFWIWVCVAAGSFFLVMSVGPVNAQLVNVLRPTERATGVAVSTTAIHMLGDVPSVPFIGGLVDHLTTTQGLAAAWNHSFLVIPVAVLLGALAWLAAGLWGQLHHGAGES